MLVSEAPGYVLRIPRESVDTVRFETLVAEARAAAAAVDHEAALVRFDDALALWRGPALAGLGPDEEVGPIVLRLDESRWSAAEDRFDSLLALGRHAEAVGPLQEAVAEHPLRERRWAQLALALYRARRQADALRALATARETLVDQLGLDPGPELRDLERQILAQDPALLVTPARVEVRAAPPTERAPVDGPAVVGRDDEWQRVRGALVAAVGGRSRLVLVEGEPGIGKTTMLDALVAEAAAGGWRVAVSRCAEPGLAPTLWPWIEVVRTVVSGGEGPSPEVDRASLAALLPGAATETENLSPIELAERIAELLRHDVAGAPRLLVLDDLHWADATTLEMVTMVLDRLPDAPLVVASGHRPPELVAGSPFAHALGVLARHPSLTRVRLPGLAADDVARLMTIVSGAEPTPEVAGRVRDRTGGNPLFVAELARLAGSHGLADDDVVPAAVRDVVRRRLAQLPPVTNDVLASAAVLGEDIELHVLAEASGDTLDEALDALDPAIATRVLVPGDGGTFRFAHALVRDAVLAELSALRLARMHKRAADAIEVVHGADADHAEPIAWHRHAALAVDDPAVVAAALVLGGDVARSRAALDRAEELATEALDVARRIPPSQARVAIEISAVESLLSLETLRNFMGTGLPDIAARIDEIAARNESTPMRQLATFTRWSMINALGPAATAEDAARALRAAEAAPDDVYTVVLGQYMAAAQAFLSGDTAAARPRYEATMRAEDVGLASDPPVRTPLPTVAGMAAMAAELAGEPDEADRLLERLRGAIAKRKDQGAEVDYVFFQCVVLGMRGDAAGTAAASAFMMEPEPRSWMPHFSPACRVLHVWARVELGDGEALLPVAAAALDELEAGPTSIGVPMFRTFHGAALLTAGRPGDAAVELRHALASSAATGDAWWRPETVRLLAEAEAALGAEAAAVGGLLDEAARLAEEQGAAIIAPRVAASRAVLH